MYFQDLIFELQRFWAEQGCVIELPLDVKVGAGTFHPATFLGVLNPVPWNAAFTQFCRRPDGGRYGNSPDPLGRYDQGVLTQHAQHTDYALSHRLLTRDLLWPKTQRVPDWYNAAPRTDASGRVA